MMTLNKAKRLGLECIANTSGLTCEQVAIIDDLTQCRRCGWIFFSAALAGPVVVTHEGEVHHLDGDRAAAVAIAEFERRARPRKVRTIDP